MQVEENRFWMMFFLFFFHCLKCLPRIKYFSYIHFSQHKQFFCLGFWKQFSGKKKTSLICDNSVIKDWLSRMRQWLIQHNWLWRGCRRLLFSIAFLHLYLNRNCLISDETTISKSMQQLKNSLKGFLKALIAYQSLNP